MSKVQSASSAGLSNRVKRHLREIKGKLTKGGYGFAPLELRPVGDIKPPNQYTWNTLACWKNGKQYSLSINLKLIDDRWHRHVTCVERGA